MKLAHRSQSTLALILGCAALALVAPGCGDDDDSTGAAGGSAGKANTGGKAGAASTGGASSGGKTGNGGATAQGGKTTSNGGSANGGTAVIGGAGAGGQEGGTGPIGNGGTTTSGGSANGGSSNGGSGNGTGGTITITGGSGGMGGEGGDMGGAGAGGGGAGGEGGAPPAPLISDSFDSSQNGWAPFLYYSSCTTCYTDTQVTLMVASGIATLNIPFSTEANTAIHTATVGKTLNGPWSNVGGKTFKVNMRWASGGIGTATGATGGFDVYLIASDSDWTESSAHFEYTSWGGDKGATTFKELSFTIPAASGNFDPATINRFTIRIDSKHWSNTTDPQPVFDYVPAVFEIDSITVQ